MQKLLYIRSVKQMQKNFYVYEWFNEETDEVFYVGKGSGKRYKDIKNRNKFFLKYIEDNKVGSRIVKYFENEDDAFNYEKELTKYYKDKGQCSCSLLDGGYGGFSKIWSDEMKEYWSINNPMKQESQRQRMKENNPMKNKEIAMKNGAAHKRQVVINNIIYSGVIDAANALNVSTDSIIQWCKQGGNINGDKCRYADEEQKEFIYKKPGSKEVYVDDQIFPSIKAAADAFGFCPSSFAKSLKKKDTYKGHKCGYVNQQPSQ